MDDLAPEWFLRQLAETRLWCQARANVDDPEHCLRSSELRPVLEANGSEDRAIWLHPKMIGDVARRRHIALSSSGVKDDSMSTVEATGRVLLCAYDYTNHNAATAVTTNYFLDEHDVPPWDCWVGEVRGLGSASAPGSIGEAWPPTLDSTLGQKPPNQGLLVCWIPTEFIGVVDRGLEVECIGMLCWADMPVRGGAAGPDFDSVIPTWLRGLAL